MKNKTIRDFLNNYDQNKWSLVIPSLLEIAILNLYTSFKRYIFSDEDLLLILENLKLKYAPPLKTKSIINNKNSSIDIDIPKFRKNLKINFVDYMNERRDSYRSYTKKAKNINELNIYSNKKRRLFHYYNKSTESTPLKTLVNYNESDLSNKNIFKIKNINKRLVKNNIKNINMKNNNNKKLVDYNTIEQSHYTENSYQGLFNIKNFNANMNFSFSLENNKQKEYIKVNKNNQKIETQKDNKINKIIKNKIINGISKGSKKNFNLFSNYNKNQILKQYNKLDLNKTNYCNDKLPKKPGLSDNFNLSQNSRLKKIPDFKRRLSKLQKNNNNMIIKNNNSQIINNKKIIKNIRFSNIKKNLLDINLRNLNYNKEIKIENRTNKDLFEEINNTVSNINDIGYSRHNPYTIKTFSTFNNKKTKNIINYNSFNNNKDKKTNILFNEPFAFDKKEKIKNIVQNKKIYFLNANDNDIKS